MPKKFGFSPPNFEIIRASATSFSGMAAFANTTYELSGVDRSERVIGGLDGVLASAVLIPT